jgi:hypothetical protein
MRNIQKISKYPTATKLNLAAMLISAQSRLESEPNRTQKRLQKVEILLTSARDQVARGELLTRTDVRRLNKAFDDLAAPERRGASPLACSVHRRKR